MRETLWPPALLHHAGQPEKESQQFCSPRLPQDQPDCVCCNQDFNSRAGPCLLCIAWTDAPASATAVPGLRTTCVSPARSGRGRGQGGGETLFRPGKCRFSGENFWFPGGHLLRALLGSSVHIDRIPAQDCPPPAPSPEA